MKTLGMVEILQQLPKMQQQQEMVVTILDAGWRWNYNSLNDQGFSIIII
jgi:hypothetical protein